MDKKIMDFIADDWRLERLVAEMPDEYMDYILELIAPPFDVVCDTDREMIIFMYILHLIRFMYYYGEELDGENSDTLHPELFYALESIFDSKPEYRTERFWDDK